MSRFIVHSIVYILLTGVMAWILCLSAGPYTDPFYLRFTTPLQQSLVIGSSKAAQGIVPEVMNEELDKAAMKIKLYNYGFTIKSSPYGEPYLNSILKKIDRRGSIDKENRIFILAVDPWSISTMFLKKQNGEDIFVEKDFAPNNMLWPTLNPNPEYIFKNIDNRPLMIFRKFRNTNLPKVNSDGSFEVPLRRDSLEVSEIVADKVLEYEQYAASNSFSKARFEYLERTIDSLENYGKIFLVRIPVHHEIRKIEDKFMSNFTSIITEMAGRHHILFFDYEIDKYKLKTTDGNHLDRKSGMIFSKILANDIINSNNQPKP
jgi:hypothetical protein